MKLIFIGIVYVGFCWGFWPLLARSAGETGMTGSVVLSVVATSAVIAGGAVRGFEPIDLHGLWKLFMAGLMMGSGLIIFNYVASSPMVDISRSVPAINTLMITVTAAGGILYFRESLTLEKLVGLVLIAIGIFLLRPSS